MAGSPQEPAPILAAPAPERQGPPHSGHACRSGAVHPERAIVIAKLWYVSRLLLVTLLKQLITLTRIGT
jgi:hypothetical protein